MINRRNWLKLVLVLLCSLIVAYFIVNSSFIDLDRIAMQGAPFQYNLLSTSSIIAGFLFTGISILLSVIDKDRIRRLWEHNYLDNLYRVAFIGIMTCIITATMALVSLIGNLPDSSLLIVLKIELVSLIISIIFFSWCVIRLFTIIKKLKPTKK